jgi:hypothetical protein
LKGKGVTDTQIQRISEERAELIATALLNKHNLGPDRVVVIGRGRSAPKQKVKGAPGNNRVEVVVLRFPTEDSHGAEAIEGARGPAASEPPATTTRASKAKAKAKKRKGKK